MVSLYTQIFHQSCVTHVRLHSFWSNGFEQSPSFKRDEAGSRPLIPYIFQNIRYFYIFFFPRSTSLCSSFRSILPTSAYNADLT